jgi:hypothetical protein
MTTLQQIELVRSNIEDLSIVIQDRFDDVDRALNEIPVLVAQRAAEHEHLQALLRQRAAELDELERFEDPDAADVAAGVEAMFGPEIAAQFLDQARQRQRG